MRQLLFSALFLVLISSAVLAEEYYADVLFEVAPDGSVAISGTTNHPSLAERTTQDFTSKNKQYWLLNITLPDEFSDYVFTVELPPGATVNYVHSKNLNIFVEDDHVIIKSIGSKAKLSIVMQYTIANKKVDYVFEILGAIASAAFLCSILALAYWRGGKLRKKMLEQQAPKLVDGLSVRQQEIVALLKKAGGSLTQKQIEKELKLPKASVSRNIEALRRKDIIERQQNGMSNVVKLKKD